MTRFSAQVQACLPTQTDLGGAIGYLNSLAQALAAIDRFITLIVLQLDPKTHTVTMVNAGHPPPLLVHRATGIVEEMNHPSCHGPMLGAIDGFKYQSHQFQLAPGDTIVVYSDGMDVAIMGFDSISGERQHRSVRFWAVRSRRGSYFMAKFLGLTATVSLVFLIMHIVIWCVCMFGGAAPPASVLNWGVRFWLSSVPIVAAWSALATFLGSLFRTPIIALLVICSTTFVLFVIRLIGSAAKLPAITWVYPNKYDDLLLHPHPQTVAQGVGGLLAFCLVWTLLGTTLFAKRDV